VKLVTVFAAFLLGTGSAHAAYGEYRVLMAEVYENGPHRLGDQLAAFPGVKEIDYVDTSEVTPTAAELAKYDLVVSVGDSNYADIEGWGNALADYVDGGGVVVQTAYDTWEDVGGTFGRLETGGYEPLLPGDNVNDTVELGTFDATSPLMQGVGKLLSSDNTESEAAAGATVVAKWTNGANAIAVKGRVVAISGFLGDNYGEEEIWDGNYGQVLFNALRTLGPQAPIPSPAPTPVVAPVTPPPPPPNLIKLGKLTRNETAGTAKLTVVVPAAGSLTLSGKGLKKATVTSTAVATLTVPVKLVGKKRKTLNKKGKAKATATLSFTPTGGTAGVKTRKLTLKKSLG
jgi:hypothetical protein